MSSFALCGNIYVPEHMASVPKRCHLNRAMRRGLRPNGKRYVPEGPTVMTDECRVQWIVEKESWGPIDSNRKMGMLKDLGFDIDKPIKVRQDERLIEFTQGWED